MRITPGIDAYLYFLAGIRCAYNFGMGDGIALAAGNRQYCWILGHTKKVTIYCQFSIPAAARYSLLAASSGSSEIDAVVACSRPHANTSGRMNKAAKVEAINPPMTARPNGEL